MVERVSYDRGVHLRGTSLWFDAERARGLCVVTGLVDKLPAAHKRALATAELAAMLSRAGHGAVLPAPMGRWISIGGHEVKFVDVGAGPAAAAVLVCVGAEQIVVTGALQATSNGWPECDHLVAHVPALGHRGGSWSQARAALRAFVTQGLAQGRRPVVLVESVSVGLAVLAELRGQGLAPRALGLLGKLSPDVPEVQASVALARTRIPAGSTVLFVDTGLGEWRRTRTRRAPPDVTLRVKWYADVLAVQRVVTAVGARHVSLVRAPATHREQVERLLGRGVQVRWLTRPRQLELAPELAPVADA